MYLPAFVERIGQSSSVIINSKTENGDTNGVDGVMSGRYGLKIFRILKKRWKVEVQLSKRTVEFFGFDEIRSVWVLSDREALRSYTPQEAPLTVGRQPSGVSIGHYNLSLFPRVT